MGASLHMSVVFVTSLHINQVSDNWIKLTRGDYDYWRTVHGADGSCHGDRGRVTFRSVQLSCWVRKMSNLTVTTEWPLTNIYVLLEEDANKQRGWSDGHRIASDGLFVPYTPLIISSYRSVKDFLVTITTDKITNISSLNIVWHYYACVT